MQEAQVNEPQNQSSITTDDLVFMIGEKEVQLRDRAKNIAMLTARCKELLAENARLKAVEQKTIDATKKAESLSGRILDLEKQVHETALERDAARHKLSEMIAVSNKAFEELETEELETEPEGE
jgi:hypothetical protein